MLEAVSAAMIELHRRYHHRKPVTAKSRMLGDDLLACVLGGVYTEVEKTLIELERTALVQEARSAFQVAMQDRFVADVQRITGRPVETFVSNSVVGPDLEIELFFLGKPQ